MGPQVTRKLTIRTKLAATLAVPLAALAAFAALQVRSAYNTAAEVKSQAGVATSATGPGGVVTALLAERDYETLRVLGLQKQAAYLGVGSSQDARDTTNARIGSFRTSLNALGKNVQGNYVPALQSVGANLKDVRGKVDDLGSHVSSSNAKAAAGVYDEYSAQIDTLLNADQQAEAQISDAQMRSGVELLNALNRQSDLESRMVIETVLASISQDPALVAQVQQLAGQRASGEADLKVRATDEFASALTPALTAPARVAAVQKLDHAAADPRHTKVAAVLALPPDLLILRTARSPPSNRS